MSATCNPSPSRPYASSAESDTSLGSQDGAMRPRSIPPPPGASPASTCSSNTQGKAPMAQAIYAAPSSSVSGSPSPSRPVPDCGKRIAFSSNSTTSDSPVFGFGCAGALPGPLALAVPAPAPALCHDVAALLRQLAERDAALQQAEEEARSLAAQLCEVKLIVAEQRAVLDRLSLHPPFPDALVRAAVRRLTRTRQPPDGVENAHAARDAVESGSSWRCLKGNSVTLEPGPALRSVCPNQR